MCGSYWGICAALALTLVVFGRADVLGQSADVLHHFERGNELYKSERYEEAIREYEQVLALGYESPELYYNLGNCYYRLERIGKAILYLERARQYAQSNKLKQVIAYETMVRENNILDETTRRKWRQSIAYFNKYEMKAMEIQAHYDLARIFIGDNEISEAASHLDLAHELAVTAGYHYQHLKIERCCVPYGNCNVKKHESRQADNLLGYQTPHEPYSKSKYSVIHHS